MFAIVEKMISLVSFDARLGLAGSFGFFYLIFSNFKFFLRMFKGLITLKKTKGFLIVLHHFRMQNLYISINSTKNTFCLFKKNLFSIQNFIASGRSTTAATSEMELFLWQQLTTRNRWLLLQIAPPYMLQSYRGSCWQRSLFVICY